MTIMSRYDTTAASTNVPPRSRILLLRAKGVCPRSLLRMMQAKENSSYVSAWKGDRDAADVIDVARHAGVQPVGLRMMERALGRE